MLLFQCCALCKVHLIDGQNRRDQILSDQGANASDQIAFCAFHSFLVEVQTNAGYMRHMRCNNLEIRIVGFSFHPQLVL